MSYKHIRIKPTSTYTGAEIEGVNLSKPLSDEAIQEIRQALLQMQSLAAASSPFPS